MEININITRLATETDDLSDFSASRAERGQNAGPETWANAKAEGGERPFLVTEDQLDALRDHMRDYGAWDDDEISGWTAAECNALLIQEAAGDLRELQSLCPGDGPGDIDWTEAERLAQRGTVSGRIFCSGDQVFHYLGD